MRIELESVEERARDLLDPGVYDFFAGGADDELTLAENVEAWKRLRLRPHVLRDVSAVATETTVLGTPISAPVVVAPVALQRLVHPAGEVAMVQGAVAAGSLPVVSTRSSVPFEDVGQAAAGRSWWFQVYAMRDRACTAELVARAAASGCRALVLTADTPVVGRKRRAERRGFAVPTELFLVNRPSRLPSELDLTTHAGVEHDTRAGVEDLAWLRSIASLPIVVKGVLRGDDALAFVEAGAAALVVSNHGGRQLDGAIATADALPEVAMAVDGKAEVYVDGGIRRGTDIVRALALGARAVMIGRPAMWGLAVGGDEGVRGVLEAFREELARALALCGTPTAADVPADVVVGAPLSGE